MDYIPSQTENKPEAKPTDGTENDEISPIETAVADIHNNTSIEVGQSSKPRTGHT